MQRPGAPPGQQPISFKTVPNRNKTQKWQQAKSYNYDGDDWGGFDPYDEYGNGDEQAPPQAQQSNPTHAQQGYGQPSRQQDYGPRQPPFAQRIVHRTNSYDSGDDRRLQPQAPSAGPMSMARPPSEGSRGPSPATYSQASSRGSSDNQRPSTHDYNARRDFSQPQHAPPPLNTRSSPAPNSERFLPRKSSLNQSGSPPPEPTSATKEKELPRPPVIRPSDIYKRMAEEQEKERQARASADSSRPSMDSMQREAAMASSSAPLARQESLPSGSVGQPSLEPVTETGETPPQPQRSDFEPVAERPSTGTSTDYGHEKQFQGFAVDNPALARALGAQSTTSPPTSPVAFASPLQTDSPRAESTAPHVQRTRDQAETRPQLAPPALPEVGRVASAFGADFSQFQVPATPPAQQRISALQYPGQEDNERTPTFPVTSTHQHSERTPTSSLATRAPPGADPAADILNERLPTRTQPGHDPAADILAERTHDTPIHEFPSAHQDSRRAPISPLATRAPPGADPAADIMNERLPTRAQPGHDPAAEIQAERTHDTPVHEIGRQHQPGFRSVVDGAFDREGYSAVPPTSISRDNSRQSQASSSGLTRSNTDSTSGISPIMSRVPSAATAQQRAAERGAQVPSIAEEASPSTPPRIQTGSRPASQSILQAHPIPRKPSPSAGRSRNVSAETTGSNVSRTFFGTPPRSDSPARMPVVEAHDRRLSGLLAADMSHVDPPAVADQAAEIPSAHLELAETPASELSEPLALDNEARQANDPQRYATREADMAYRVNSTPDKPGFSPTAAEAERASQQQFLRSHAGPSGSTPVSPVTPPGPGNGSRAIPRSQTPTKGRVKEIAGKYNGIDEDSRRNSAVSVSSKSSWNNSWTRSEENLSLKRSRTFGSQAEHSRQGSLVEDNVSRTDSPEDYLPQYGNAGHAAVRARPEPSSEPSYRPHLPGEWVSYAPTPAEEDSPHLHEGSGAEGPMYERVAEPPHLALRESSPSSQPDHSSPETPRAAHFPAEETIDLTPTTKKEPLASRGPSDSDANPLYTLRTAGEAMAAMLAASVGGSEQHQTRDFAAPAPEPEREPAQQPRVASGDVFMRPLQLDRMASSIAPSSVASSAPPTPPAKDAPGGLAPTARQAEQARPISGYFSRPPPPLEPGRSMQNSLDSSTRRPTILPSLSTDTTATDVESDRLRKEIVRTLNPVQRESIKRESIMDEQVRTQDALEASKNPGRVKVDEAALPAAETRTRAPAGYDPAAEIAAEKRHETPVAELRRPEVGAQNLGLLDQRFSWENSPQHTDLYDPTVGIPESPARSYERPGSSGRALHVVNAKVDEIGSPDSAAADKPPVLPEATLGRDMLDGAGSGPALVSPISNSEEQLSGIQSRGEEQHDIAEAPPSPISTDPLRHSEVPTFTAGDYDDDDEPDSPEVPFKDFPPSSHTSITRSSEDLPSPGTAMNNAATRSSHQQARLPPFRQILTIKDTSERINTYNSTREQFATMNTGLGDWLAHMNQQPDHLAALPSLARLRTSGTGFGASARGHKHSPSILKFTKQFGSSADADRQRQGSLAPDPESAASGTSIYDDGTASGVSREKMPARGKELLKNANVLGGKAATGAKGLFAKGKSRFNRQSSLGGGGASGEKAPPTSSSSSSLAFQPSRPSATAFPPTVPTPPPAYETSDTQSSLSVPRSRQPSASPNERSRPLSATFARLRERSRSKSTSRSQPSSLVIAKTDSTPEVPYLVREPGGGRTEPWNADSAQLPDRTGTPGRLGVLPSPPNDTFPASGHDGRRRSDGAVGEDGHVGRSVGAPVSSDETPESSSRYELKDEASTGTNGKVYVQPDYRPETQTSNALPEITRVVPQRKVEDEDELYSATPTATRAPAPWNHARTKSDFETLPSMQKTAGEEALPALPRSLQSPGHPSQADADEQLPAEQQQAPGAELDPQHGAEPSAVHDEIAEELSLHSRPSSLGGWEMKSPESPQQHFKDVRERAAPENDGASRRSSVSSIGSPDTAVQSPLARDRTIRGREAAQVSSHPQVASPSSARNPTLLAESQYPAAADQSTPSQQAVSQSLEQPPSTQPLGAGPKVPLVQQVLQPPVKQRISEQQQSPAQNRLVYRQYRTGGSRDDRPMSYMPLGQASNGALRQENIDVQRDAPESVNLYAQNALSAGQPQMPPLDRPPGRFEPRPVPQRMPSNGRPYSSTEQVDKPAATRQQVSSQGLPEQMYGDPYESKLGAPEHTSGDGDIHAQRFTSLVIDPRLHAAEYQLPGVGPPEARPPLEARSKKYSGLFRGPDQPDQVSNAAQPVDRIDPQTIAGASQQPISDDAEDLLQTTNKLKKHRSGILRSFSRSPRVIASDFSRNIPIPNASTQGGMRISPAGVSTPRSGSQGGTLKKAPLRAASAAMAPSEPKKKRSSWLGSLFGRSNTQGHNTERPKKLATMYESPSQSASQPQPQPQPQAQRQVLARSNSVRDYSAYEAMRRQQIRDLSGSSPDIPRNDESPYSAARPSQPPVVDARAMSAPGGLPPPPGGWYAPGQQEPTLPDVSLPPRSPPQQHPSVQRLQSAGYRPDLKQAAVPGAFRPVSASYAQGSRTREQQHEQVSSPQTTYRVPPGTVRSVTQNRGFSNERVAPSQYPVSRGPPLAKHLSSGSMNNLLSQQVSTASQYHGSYGPESTVLPLQQTRSISSDLSHARGYRMNSLGGEIAMSSEESYSDQQTPWALNMPRGANGSQQSSRASSWAYQGPGDRNARPHPPAQDYSGPPHQRQPSYSYLVPPPQYISSRPPEAPYRAPPQRTTNIPTSNDPPPNAMAMVDGAAAYPSPPYSASPGSQFGQQQYPPPGSSASQNYHSPMGPPMRGRYHASRPSRTPPIDPQRPMNPQGRPRNFSRNAGAYRGFQGERRDAYGDDRMDSEERLEMRGASYPGQEWAPPGMSEY